MSERPNCQLDTVIAPPRRSLADQDSDRWVLEVLAPDLRRKMKSLKETVQWTDLVCVSLSGREGS
jgi:hypothetical protein